MEPSPIGERSRVLSGCSACGRRFQSAEARGITSPALDAPTCRDESALSLFVRPAGHVEHPPPSMLCGMVLAPAMAGSGLRERLATSAMQDGNDDGRVAVPRAHELTVPDPSQCCLEAICAQNLPDARMDRPSDGVIARRRGVLKSKGESLVHLPVSDAHAQSPAVASDAVSRTAPIVHDDSVHSPALIVQDLCHDRPSYICRPAERIGLSKALGCCHSIPPRRTP